MNKKKPPIKTSHLIFEYKELVTVNNQISSKNIFQIIV